MHYLLISDQVANPVATKAITMHRSVCHAWQNILRKFRSLDRAVGQQKWAMLHEEDSQLCFTCLSLSFSEPFILKEVFPQMRDLRCKYLRPVFVQWVFLRIDWTSIETVMTFYKIINHMKGQATCRESPCSTLISRRLYYTLSQNLRDAGSQNPWKLSPSSSRQ